MHPMGDIRKHFWLTLGMAKHTKVDLGAALKDGKITQEEYAGMVNACRGCDEPEACAHWLKTADEGAAPPAYCRNADTFAEIAG